MPHYKLHYFNLRGRAELSRLILKQAGVEFEDIRFERSEWPALKASKSCTSQMVYSLLFRPFHLPVGSLQLIVLAYSFVCV